MERQWKLFGVGLSVAVALILPLFVTGAYMLSVLTLALMYLGLALGYDILAGHLGSISLAHPVFFGLGAYSAAILAGDYNVPFWGNMLIALVLAAFVAAVISVPAFRLRELSFAVATLGFALTAQIVALNWVDVTAGPRCIRAIPRPSISLGAGNAVYLSTPTAYYYLFLGLAVIVGVIYLLVTSWRLGRTFTAIRNDEIMAASIGIDVIRYKRLAFLIGAGLAGATGSLWAQYLTVTCPSNLGIAITNTLLILIFVGGAGHFAGVAVAAVLLTIIPELLRIAPSTRLIIYGLLLLVMVITMPDGFAGLLRSLSRRIGGRSQASVGVEKSTSSINSSGDRHEQSSD